MNMKVYKVPRTKKLIFYFFCLWTISTGRAHVIREIVILKGNKEMNFFVKCPVVGVTGNNWLKYTFIF